MNFLAHYVIATRFLPPISPRPEYVLGNALPDLLPLAASKSRLRSQDISRHPAVTAEERAIRAGVLAHLATDAAFHKTAAFAAVQAQITALLQSAGFDGIRVRVFFLSHILVEMALDAALLRAEPALADLFYQEMEAADILGITRWTETAVEADLPQLPMVLTRFQQSRYLRHYAQEGGVVSGINRICLRARQDTFAGDNEKRLIGVTAQATALLQKRASLILAATAGSLAL